MTKHYSPEFVETFPMPMTPAVFYISIEYNTCGHLCACGCGNEVVTPLSPAQWSFAYDGKDVSVWPSVGNWGLPCKAHYVIERGNVEWARQYNDEEVALNRSRDRAALTRMDRRTSAPDSRTAHSAAAAGTTRRTGPGAIGRWFRNLLSR